MKQQYELQFETTDSIELEDGEYLVAERHQDAGYCAALEAELREVYEVLAVVASQTGFLVLQEELADWADIGPISPTVH